MIPVATRMTIVRPSTITATIRPRTSPSLAPALAYRSEPMAASASAPAVPMTPNASPSSRRAPTNASKVGRAASIAAPKPSATPSNNRWMR